MANGLTGKRTIAVLLVLLALVPTSLSFALNEEKEEKKIENFIELAERAKDKIETLINITQANTTAMDIIDDDTDLYNAFLANVSLFDDAVQNITYARENLAEGDYESAIANVTYALEAFRDIFKAIHTILRDSGLAKGELIDAQGLIQAMKRALERIERLEGIGGLPVEVEWLLGNATLRLNITAAIEWLQEGRVSDTAHNLTQANKLIADAHKALKDAAKEMNTNRIRNHFKVMYNFRERLQRQLEKVEDKDEVEETLGLADGFIGEAEGFFDDEEYPEALEKLEDARDALDLAEQQLKAQRQLEKASGNGKGNGGD